MKWQETEFGYEKKSGKLAVNIQFTDEDPRGPWEWSVFYGENIVKVDRESTPVTAKKVCSAFLAGLRESAVGILS